MGLDDLAESSGEGPAESVVPVLRRALGHAEDEEWQAMSEALTEALKEDPDDPHLICWLGVAEREMGLEGAAYERFKRALAVGSSDPILLAIAGSGIAAFDDPEAEAALRTASLLAPGLAQVRWRYGAYLSREGMIEEALGELEEAVRLDPDDSVIWVEKGVAEALGGDHGAAARAFERAVELDPADGWSLVLLGLARLEVDELEDAFPVLEEGARRRPEDVDAQLLASLALGAAGWDDRALEMLERARISGNEADRVLIDQVDERLQGGGDVALEFMKDALAPSSYRQRLLSRP